MIILYKKFFRDLIAHWAEVGAIAFVLALGIAVFAGPLLAQKDLVNSVDTIYQKTHYENFSAEVELAPAASVNEVKAVPNVKSAEGRLVGEVMSRIGKARPTLRMVSIPDRGRSSVNDLIVEEGSYPEPDEENVLLADHHLASEFGLEPGDEITVIKDGVETKCSVVGIVTSPEYIRLSSGGADYVSDPSQFGIVFAPYAETSRILGLEGSVNNFVVTVDDRDRLNETINAVEEVLEPYGVISLTRGEDEAGASMLDLEIAVFWKVGLFLSLMLLCVAALALYITMTLIVFSQRREIGVLRSQGCTRRTILLHYTGYGMILGVVGVAFGIPGGYYLSKLLINIYGGIMDIPLVTVSFYGGIIAIGVSIGVIFSLAGAAFPAWSAARMRPAEAMRTDSPFSGSLVLHHKAKKAPITGRFPGWLKVAFRNLWRNRRRTVLTFLGVTATICLMIVGYGGRDSLDNTAQEHLNVVMKWDALGVFSRPVGDDTMKEVKAIDGVTSAEPMIVIPASINNNGESLDLQIQAYEEGTRFHDSKPTKGSKAYPGPGEILLNRGVTRVLPINIGDTVKVTVDLRSMPDALKAQNLSELVKNRSLEFKVAGFVSEPFGGIAYVSYDYLQNFAKLISAAIGSPTQGEVFNVVAVGVRKGMEKRVAAELAKIPNVVRAISKSTMLRIWENLISAIKTLFIIFYVMTFAMGFAILFTLITVNTMERRREVGTMRTLGSSRLRVFSFVTVENLFIITAAVVPGVLLGWFAEWFLVEYFLTNEQIVPDTVLSAATIALVVLVTYGVMIVSQLPSLFKLWRMDLARETKVRDD